MTGPGTTPTAEYRPPAKFFHWLTAVCIVTVVTLGIAMVSAQPGNTQNALYFAHKSFGILILMLTGLRLLWRLYSPPPPLPPEVPAWQANIAAWTHRGLYAFLFAVPLGGWLGTSAYGAPIDFFGLFQLPPLLDKNEDLAGKILTVHKTAAFTLVAVLAVHIGASLHHHFVRKDTVLKRMLPHG